MRNLAALLLALTLLPSSASARQWESEYVNSFDKLKGVRESDPRPGAQHGWQHRRIAESANQVRFELGFNEISRQIDAQLAHLFFEFPKGCSTSKTGNEFVEAVTYTKPSYCGTKAKHGKKECDKLDVPSGTCVAVNSRFESLVGDFQGKCSMAAKMAFLEQDTYACGELQFGTTAVTGKETHMTVGAVTDWQTRELISVAPANYKRLATYRIKATKSEHEFHLGRRSKQIDSTFTIHEQASRSKQTVKLGATEGALVTYSFQNRGKAQLQQQLATSGFMDHFAEVCVHLPGFEVNSPTAKSGLTGIDDITLGKLKVWDLRACALVRVRFTSAPNQDGGWSLALSVIDLSKPKFKSSYSGLDYQKEPWAVLAQVGSFLAGSLLNLVLPGAGVVLDAAALVGNAAIAYIDLGALPMVENFIDGNANLLMSIAWRSGLEDEVRANINAALSPIAQTMTAALGSLPPVCNAIPMRPGWNASLQATAIQQCRALLAQLTLDPSDLLNMSEGKSCFTSDYETIARPSLGTSNVPWMNETPERGGCRLNLTFNAPARTALLLPFIQCAAGQLSATLNQAPLSMQQSRDWGVSRLVTDPSMPQYLGSTIANACVSQLPPASAIPGYVQFVNYRSIIAPRLVYPRVLLPRMSTSQFLNRFRF